MKAFGVKTSAFKSRELTIEAVLNSMYSQKCQDISKWNLKMTWQKHHQTPTLFRSFTLNHGMTQPTPDTHLLMLYTLFKAIRPPESLFRWEGTLRIYLVYANSLKLTVWLIMVDTTTGPPFQSTRTSTCPVQQGRTLRINATALNAQIAGRSWPANVYGEHGRQPPEPIQTCFIYIYIYIYVGI